MYRDEEIEGVCFAYNVTNSVEDELQYIFVESLINSPYVIWIDSTAADNTNKNTIESNQHNCCSSDHENQGGRAIC